MYSKIRFCRYESVLVRWQRRLYSRLISETQIRAEDEEDCEHVRPSARGVSWGSMFAFVSFLPNLPWGSLAALYTLPPQWGSLGEPPLQSISEAGRDLGENLV